MNTLRIYYKCEGCKHRGGVQVVARKENENVVDWIQRVSRLVQFDHNVISPRCAMQKVDMAIPLDQDDPNSFIGKASERLIAPPSKDVL
jgi:UDP-galactopyranose mutase